MAIPYYLLGGVYLLGVIFSGIFFFFSLYHLRRFGFFDFTAFVVTVLTTGVIAIVLMFTIIFLRQTDWASSGTLFDTNGLSDLIEEV